MHWPFYVSVAAFVVACFLWQPKRTILAVTGSRSQLLFVLAIYILYIIFATRRSVHTDPEPLYKTSIYGLMHVLSFFALQIHAYGSRENAIRICRAFVAVLLTSFLFCGIGLLFPLQIFGIRYFLYGNIYDQFEHTGFLGLLAFTWRTGIAPHLYLFGYQVAAGTALVIASFMMSRRLRALWGALALFCFGIVIVVAQRSVLPALVIALVVLYLLKPRPPGRVQAIMTSASAAVALALVVVMASALTATLVSFVDEGDNVELLQERVGSDDLRTRLGMQLASMEIIATHPLGLVAQDRAEEQWGTLAEKLGYEVVVDANHVDYALVHNGYLRIIMYLGWLAGIAIIASLTYVLREFLQVARLARILLATNEMIVRYALLAASAVAALVVQAMFHNDSIFTFERTSWTALCILLLLTRQLKSDLRKKCV